MNYYEQYYINFEGVFIKGVLLICKSEQCIINLCHGRAKKLGEEVTSRKVGDVEKHILLEFVGKNGEEDATSRKVDDVEKHLLLGFRKVSGRKACLLEIQIPICQKLKIRNWKNTLCKIFTI